MIGLWAPRDSNWNEVSSALSNTLCERWKDDVSAVKQLAALVTSKELFTPQPSSALQLDDEKIQPYGCSQATRHNLSAGVLQLQAAQDLLDSGAHRSVAAATLLRSALETLAVGFWIAHPEDQAERMTRTLAWFMSNLTDERLAFADHAGRQLEPDERPGELREVARRAGLDLARVNGGVQSSPALRYVDNALGIPNQTLLYSWRLCSGVAHGRSWALANLASLPIAEPGVSLEELSFDATNLLVPFGVAMMLLNELLGVIEERTNTIAAGPPDATDVTVS
jgi:hypothetical protein